MGVGPTLRAETSLARTPLAVAPFFCNESSAGGRAPWRALPSARPNDWRPPLQRPSALFRSVLLSCAFVPSGALLAQSNAVAGRDLMLVNTWDLEQYQRVGTYPNGRGAMGAWTTVCNRGTAPIPFTAAMNPNHSFIHYMVCRESDGRFVQVSSRGWVKHTFGSNNDPSTCGSCAGPGNYNQVEVGCSDTYANYQAVDHYWLGPPEEIDPWLGTWDPQCSFFDRGEPAASPAQACDSVRSLTQSQATALNTTVHHQTAVHDADWLVPGANFYYQAGYNCPGEPEANRMNTMGSRGVVPTWNGTRWQFADTGFFVNGTILQRWSGATVTSATNGNDDGRCYVAVKVTGPVSGLYRYEYAIHNRDNDRGIGAFRIPVCPQARVTNLGFRDVDQDPLNQWTASRSGGEIAFASSGNPLRWNTLFNFWFDCDAAPATGQLLSLDQHDIGPGALTLQVQGTAPIGLYNQVLGVGCGSPVPPVLYAAGTPARATLGNTAFSLGCSGNPAGVPVGFVLSLAQGTTQLATGCTLFSAGLATTSSPVMAVSDAGGTAGASLAVPSSPALEGLALDFQAFNVRQGGALLGAFDLSNGLRVRVGNLVSGCP